MGMTAFFYRKDGFYPVELLDPMEWGTSLEAHAAEHAELNPGTVKLEDMYGDPLWPAH